MPRGRRGIRPCSPTQTLPKMLRRLGRVERGGTMELSGNPESGLRVFPSAVIQSVRSPPLRRAGADPGGERRCGAAARDPFRALCSSARSKSCRRWSLRSAASGLTPSSHLPITIIDLGGGRERILGPRPDAGSLRLPPSGSFTSAFPNTTTQGEECPQRAAQV